MHERRMEARQREIEARNIALDQQMTTFRHMYRRTMHDLHTLEESRRSLDDQISATLSKWAQDEPEQDFHRILEHLQRCSKALPQSRYLSICAMLWVDGIPNGTLQAIHAAVDAEKTIDRVNFQSELFWYKSIGDCCHVPEDRETFPEYIVGDFGFEADPKVPNVHVCANNAFCHLFQLEEERLDLDSEAEVQQEYLMASLQIRMAGLESARNAIPSFGNAAPACDTLIIEAFYCWLSQAIPYVHDRANHPEQIQAAFEEAGKDFDYGDPEDWEVFETTFRQTVGNVFSGLKRIEWLDRISRSHRNPLSGLGCNGMRRTERNPISPITHEYFEAARADGESDGSSLTTASSRATSVDTITPTRHRHQRTRAVDALPQVPVSTGSDQDSTPRADRHAQATRTASVSTDADGDDDMEDEEMVWTRSSFKQTIFRSRNRTVPPSRDAMPSMLEEVTAEEEEENEEGVDYDSDDDDDDDDNSDDDSDDNMDDDSDYDEEE